MAIQTLPASAIRDAMMAAEAVCQSQRSCIITWVQDGKHKRVQAREGIPTQAQIMDLGITREELANEFVVLRPLLDEAPPIGTVISIVCRKDRWRLREIESGLSCSDPVWTFICVEEFS